MSASVDLPDSLLVDARGEIVNSLTERDTFPASETERHSRPSRRGVIIRLYGGIEPLWLKAVASRLNRLLDLEAGWDSYGARAIKLEAVRGSIHLLDRLGSDVRAPEIFPSSDGSLTIEWNTGEGVLEIKFEGEDRIGFFAEESNGKETESEGLSQARFIADFYPKVAHLIPRG
jgi:hypothetical protein